MYPFPHSFVKVNTKQNETIMQIMMHVFHIFHFHFSQSAWENKTKQNSNLLSDAKKNGDIERRQEGYFVYYVKRDKICKLKNKKKMSNFCADHTAVIPILVIMIIFSFFLRHYNMIGIPSNALSMNPCLVEKDRCTHFWPNDSAILQVNLLLILFYFFKDPISFSSMLF